MTSSLKGPTNAMFDQLAKAEQPIMWSAVSFVPEVHSLNWLTFGPNLTGGRHLIAARRAKPFLHLFAYQCGSDDFCLNVTQDLIASHRSP